MMLTFDLFWSFRSPYSYLLMPRLLEFERDYDVKTNVRPIYPIAVRIDGFFKNVNPLWRAYLVRDGVRHQAAAGRVRHLDKDDGDRLCRLLHCRQTWIGPEVNQVRPACGDLGGAGTNAVDVLRCEMHIELDVAAYDPAKFRESLLECRPEVPHLRIVFILEGDQDPNPSRTSGLLRADPERPYRRRAKSQHELPPPCMTRKEHSER
jgi:hypothetical protein